MGEGNTRTFKRGEGAKEDNVTSGRMRRKGRRQKRGGEGRNKEVNKRQMRGRL